jgi:hypothetical protein
MGFRVLKMCRRLRRSLSHFRQLKIYRAWVFQQFLCLCELLLSRFVDLYLLSINSNVLALKIIRKTVKSSSISLLVFTFRKGISQLLECDDCACFMSKYSTRNASCIYIVEPTLSLMITKRLLDVVSCEFKKKMFKERRSCGSNEGPVKFLSTLDLLSNFGTLYSIFFVKYTKMLYQWQLVKNKVIQSNLEFQNPPLGLSPTCTCGTRFVPLALNSPPTL